MIKFKVSLAIATLFATTALAEAPVVESVEATQSGETWTFSVTLSHPDTGWDHYANGWRIEDADGNILGQRDLAHPHVEEQPFTRSLSGVEIPEGTEAVLIRASCLEDGWNEEAVPFIILEN